MERIALLFRKLRRAVLRRRRLLAALAAGTAVAAGLHAASPPPSPTTMVLTAAHDIAAGAAVGPDDLARVEFEPDSVPAGVLRMRDVVGRTTAAPLRAGEPLTDVRLLTAALLDTYPGTVAAPIRIGDPGAVSLLRVGDRVDVLAADPNRAVDAHVVAADVPVVALPKRTGTGSSLVSGGLVVLAVPEASAIGLAAAGVSSFLSITIRP